MERLDDLEDYLLAEAAERYLGIAQQVDGWRAADPKRARLRVRGIDEGSELLRAVVGYRDEPMSLPTELY